ncbi:MAG: glycine cleavage system protein GcvH [Gemmatimonadetes bacterium]|nr:glycine cleavage system protein GcvH [Gemmatimonadota bacterium]
MNVPQELRYTEEHEWISVDDQGVGTIGITDYAQGELGDVVFVELPEQGRRVAAKEAFGTIEAVKAVSELYSPVDGEVVEVNRGLDEKPELVNAEPYGGGWMIRVKLDRPDELGSLLSASDYEKHVG